MKKDEMVCDCDVIHEDVVDAVRKILPDERELYDLSDFFKVLGDSTRVKIMWALDESEMCVCDLAVLLGMTKSAVSHQLRSLREANLVKNRREGKNVFYSLADDHVKQIFEKGLEHIREKKD
jgi:ArsR family transcriptional regulator